MSIQNPGGHIILAIFAPSMHEATYMLQAKLLEVWHAWANCRTWTLVTLKHISTWGILCLQHLHWILRQCISFNHWRCWHLWQVAYLSISRLVHMTRQRLWLLSRSHLHNQICSFMVREHMVAICLFHKLQWLEIARTEVSLTSHNLKCLILLCHA